MCFANSELEVSEVREALRPHLATLQVGSHFGDSVFMQILVGLSVRFLRRSQKQEAALHELDSAVERLRKALGDPTPFMPSRILLPYPGSRTLNYLSPCRVCLLAPLPLSRPIYWPIETCLALVFQDHVRPVHATH